VINYACILVVITTLTEGFHPYMNTRIYSINDTFCEVIVKDPLLVALV
jgi:hypothetical protein